MLVTVPALPVVFPTIRSLPKACAIAWPQQRQNKLPLVPNVVELRNLAVLCTIVYRDWNLFSLSVCGLLPGSLSVVRQACARLPNEMMMNNFVKLA